MHEIFKEIDWNQIIFTIWSVLLLPVITYAGTQDRKSTRLNSSHDN